jgi:hypothetical protein
VPSLLTSPMDGHVTLFWQKRASRCGKGCLNGSEASHLRKSPANHRRLGLGPSQPCERKANGCALVRIPYNTTTTTTYICTAFYVHQREYRAPHVLTMSFYHFSYSLQPAYSRFGCLKLVMNPSQTSLGGKASFPIDLHADRSLYLSPMKKPVLQYN